jgi:predicted branched-subunit amino acid permease
MTITISSNGFIMFLGIAVIAWLAGNVGSLIGIMITAIRTPSLDGGKFWISAGMLMLTAKLQVVKIPFALAAAAVALLFFPHASVTAAASVCAVAAVALMLLIGLNQRS